MDFNGAEHPCYRTHFSLGNFWLTKWSFSYIVLPVLGLTYTRGLIRFSNCDFPDWWKYAYHWSHAIRVGTSVDSDQMASSEASWPGSTLFSNQDKSRFTCGKFGWVLGPLSLSHSSFLSLPLSWRSPDMTEILLTGTITKFSRIVCERCEFKPHHSVVFTLSLALI